MGSSIYDDIGGTPAVTALVDGLHERLVADPDLRSWFDGRDMAHLKAHQRALVTVALGGTSAQYGGRMMHPAHSGLAVTNDAFDKVLHHLLTVLTEAGVPAVMSARILAILEPLRADVVQSPLVAVT